MNLTEEWKSQFPVGKVSNTPLLCSNLIREASRKFLGPLCFNPKPETEPQLLFTSPCLCPPILSPCARLSFSRFLTVSSSIPPSLSSSIAAQFGSQNLQDDAASVFSQNRLQILPGRGKHSVLIFFPTGSNHDQVGFLLLSVENSALCVKGMGNGDIWVTKERFYRRIVRILVNPVDFAVSSGESVVTIGFLMAYTLHSIHWYSVSYSESLERPVLNKLGCKMFKHSSIVGACWSPHIAEECLVLLENGVVFLFDMDEKSSGQFRGKRLKVSWDEQGMSRKDNWLGVEFSWHHQIFIVARSDKVFLVDQRFDECNVTCLAKPDTLSAYTSAQTEQFLAFSRAGADGFQFVLASHSLLFLCDVRQELRPLLQWAHGVDRPCYVDVCRLRELRSSGSRVSNYDWATESGSCIIVGSFWNSKFTICCYGPSPPADERTNVLEVSQISTPLYAWELPLNFLASVRECRCGDCILREDISKDSLPDWMNWQQKKEIVLGFGILNRYLPEILSDSDGFSGFVLIRLMSSGKLEAQEFCASWDTVKVLDVAHADSVRHFDGDNLLYLMDDGEYKFPKRFKYLKLHHLWAYLNGDLAEALDSKNRKHLFDPEQKKKSFSLDFHEMLCEKVKICGFGRDRSAPAVSLVFDDVTLPSSIFEIALRQTWAGLPTELLMLAFSTYTEFIDVLLDVKKMLFEFLVVPDMPQLPPFLLRNPSCRSSKWTHKVQPGDSLVGPVLPLPVILTLHEFRHGCPNSQEEPFGFSADAEISHNCDGVLQVTRDMAILGHGSEAHNNETVSLGDDRDDMWVDSQKPKPFISYEPRGTKGESLYEDQRLSTLVSRVKGKEYVAGSTVGNVGLKLFDDLSPIELKFDDRVASLGSHALGTFDVFKKHLSLWQDRFSPYQEFLSGYNLQT